MKHVFKNAAADELAKAYDDFFLNKADDIADQLKMAPGVSDFEAHQMVCDMVQVSPCSLSLKITDNKIMFHTSRHIIGSVIMHEKKCAKTSDFGVVHKPSPHSSLPVVAMESNHGEP